MQWVPSSPALFWLVSSGPSDQLLGQATGLVFKSPTCSHKGKLCRTLMVSAHEHEREDLCLLTSQGMTLFHEMPGVRTLAKLRS